MPALDAPMARVARQVLRALGRPATLRVFGTPDYSAPTGVTSYPGGSTDIACHAAIVEFSERQIDGTTIRRGDRRAIVARLAVGVEPVADRDKLIEGSTTWRIVGVRGYSSGAQEAAYELHLRL